MYKKLICLAAIIFSTGLMAQTQWQEGTHYKVLNEQASAQPQVKEVFSFWCPACFNFESIAIELKSKLPKHVAFTKAHVNFMGSASKDTQDAASKGMLAARVMKDEARFNEALFNAIHRERKPIVSFDDIQAIYQAAGGDGTKLAKLANSFGIRSQLKKNEAATKGFSRVPTFVVNDKYQAIFTRDMSPDQFIDLVVWLSKQK